MAAITFLVFMGLNTAVAEKPDPLFSSQLHSTSLISRSLGGAGTAMPMGVMQGLVNPALTYSYRSQLPERGAVALGYNNDTLYEKVQIPAGVSFANRDGALGLFYEAKSGSAGDLHTFVANFAGRLSEQVDAQGPVEYGLKFKYQRIGRSEQMLDPLRRDGFVQSGSGQTTDTTLFSAVDTSTALKNNHYIRTLSMDLGFYQSNVATNLDFSLVARNLLGYNWQRNSVALVETTVSDTINESIVVISKQEYEKSEEKDRGWLGSRYRALVTGVAYRVYLSNGRIELTLPLDIEIYGLFDREVDRVYIFRSGLQTRLFENFYVRFGFARAPEALSEVLSTISKENMIFGGAGLVVDPVRIDFSMGKDQWGVCATLEF